MYARVVPQYLADSAVVVRELMLAHEDGWFLPLPFLVSLLASILAATVLGYGTRFGLWLVRWGAKLLPPGRRGAFLLRWSTDVVEVSSGPSPSVGGANHLLAFAWGFTAWMLAVVISDNIFKALLCVVSFLSTGFFALALKSGYEANGADFVDTPWIEPLSEPGSSINLALMIQDLEPWLPPAIVVSSTFFVVALLSPLIRVKGVSVNGQLRLLNGTL